MCDGFSNGSNINIFQSVSFWIAEPSGLQSIRVVLPTHEWLRAYLLGIGSRGSPHSVGQDHKSLSLCERLSHERCLDSCYGIVRLLFRSEKTTYSDIIPVWGSPF